MEFEKISAEKEEILKRFLSLVRLGYNQGLDDCLNFINEDSAVFMDVVDFVATKRETSNPIDIKLVLEAFLNEPAPTVKIENKFEEIFKWLLGYYDFPQKQDGEGNLYWRKHLREKLKEVNIEIK